MLSGFSGDDSISGEAGNDTLHGGNGNDVYYFGTAHGQDTILNNHSDSSDILVS